MKTKYKLPSIAALGLAVACPYMCSGQISVGLNIKNPKVIPYEPLVAKVTIQNNTGSILKFGTGDSTSRVRFEVEKKDDKLVHKRGTTALLSGTQIVPGGKRIFTIDIASEYVLNATGLYDIYAVVDWHSSSYYSKKVMVDIVRGFEIKRISAGVPGDKNALRTYVLEYLDKSFGEDLYLRIEDMNTKAVCGVYKLGKVVRVHTPSLQVDEAGNLHVLFQTIGMKYVHAVFTPYGLPLRSETHVAKRGRIGLMQMPNGQITVIKKEGRVRIDTEKTLESIRK